MNSLLTLLTVSIVCTHAAPATDKVCKVITGVIKILDSWSFIRIQKNNSPRLSRLLSPEAKPEGLMVLHGAKEVWVLTIWFWNAVFIWKRRQHIFYWLLNRVLGTSGYRQKWGRHLGCCLDPRQVHPGHRGHWRGDGVPPGHGQGRQSEFISTSFLSW